MRYRRRVQVVGGSTYTVSLPKEWVRSLNLKHGSELVIEVMPDSSLKVRSSEETHPEEPLEEELEVSSDAVEISMIRLIASYVVGYDMMTVTCGDCSTTKLEEFVRLVTEKTIGLEITEKDKDTIVLQCLANISTFPFSEVLRTLVRLTLKSFENIEEFLRSKTTEVREVLERDDLIDKLYLYGLRQLNQVLLGRINHSSIGLNSTAHTIYLAMTLKLLERIADHLSDLVEDLEKLSTDTSNTHYRLLDYVESLRTKYIQVTNYLILEHESKKPESLGLLVDELRRLESNVAGDPALLEHAGKEHLTRISAYLRDLIELLVDTYELDKLVVSLT
ncbi:MAG: phosphate uptake regulator PhoU [Zestosphaera sp.]